MTFFPQDTIIENEDGSPLLRLQLMGDSMCKTVKIVKALDKKLEHAPSMLAALLQYREPVLLSLRRIPNAEVLPDQLRSFLQVMYNPLKCFIAVEVAPVNLGATIGLCFYRLYCGNALLPSLPADTGVGLGYCWQLHPEPELIWSLAQEFFVKQSFVVPPDKDRLLFFVGPIAVHRMYSNRRIGTTMIDCCIKEAKAQGCQLMASVSTSSFFSKALILKGFTVVKEQTFSRLASVEIEPAYPHRVLQILVMPLTLSGAST